jgi:hypothetical protein
MGLANVLLAIAAVTIVAVLFPGGLDVPTHKPLSKDSKVLDRNLLERITRLLKESSVPGYSLVVVRPGALEDVEYFTWGNRTEDGDPMTPEVLCARAPSESWLM